MNSKERIVSITGLIKSVLLKWRQILIFGIILALLAGAYRFMTLLPLVSMPEEITDEDDTKSANFDLEYSLIQENLVRKNRYIEDSIKVKINPASEGRALAGISITTPELEEEEREGSTDTIISEDESGIGVSTIASRKAVRILRYYENVINSGIQDWSDLEEEFNTSSPYLNELLSIDLENVESISVRIVAIYYNPEGAEKILKRVLEVLQSRESEATELFGKHSLMIDYVHSGTVVDKGLNTWMKDRVQEINDLTTQRDNFIKNSGGALEVSASQKVVEKQKAIKSALKYAVFGFVLGIVLISLAYAIYLVTCSAVLSARELNNQYGLYKLAFIPKEKKRGWLDQIIRKIDGSYLSSDETRDAFRIAHANITNIVDCNQRQPTVALVGDVKKEKLEWVKTQMDQVQEGPERCVFVSAANLCNDPEAVRALGKSDYSVLIAEESVSRYKLLGEVLDIVNSQNKGVLGSIILE